MDEFTEQHEHLFEIISLEQIISRCQFCGEPATIGQLIAKYKTDVAWAEQVLPACGMLWKALCKKFFEAGQDYLDNDEFCRLGERLGLLQAARFDPKVHDPAIDANEGERISIQSSVGQQLLRFADPPQE